MGTVRDLTFQSYSYTRFNKEKHVSKNWLNEKTRNPDTGKLEHSYQKTRSAINSIKQNLPYLFYMLIISSVLNTEHEQYDKEE